MRRGIDNLFFVRNIDNPNIQEIMQSLRSILELVFLYSDPNALLDPMKRIIITTGMKLICIQVPQLELNRNDISLAYSGQKRGCRIFRAAFVIIVRFYGLILSSRHMLKDLSFTTWFLTLTRPPELAHI